MLTVHLSVQIIFNMKKIIYDLKNQEGFTLLELILVVGIIAVLASAAFAVLDPLEQFRKASDAKRKSNLSEIQKILESYYHDNRRYPNYSYDDTGYADYQIKTNGANPVKEWGAAWQPYINVLPQDPSGSRNYVYYSTSDGQTYYLYASLERGEKDLQTCNNGNACTTLSGFGIPNNACGSICNYAVTSTNVSP